MPDAADGMEPSHTPEGSRPRVLVAEDNFLNQKLAQAMLDKLGYEAEIVGTGVEAVRAVLASHYDAVLMDCAMPEMDGFQATMEIRTQEASARRTPIIALTASASTDDRERCLAAGMDDHVVKPIRMEELEVALGRSLRQRSPSLSRPSDDRESPTAAVLDPDRLADLRTLDRPEGPTALSILATIFLRDTPDRLARLRRAVLESDAESVGDETHYLRGAAANMGARRVAAVCGELEAAARSNELSSAPGLLDRLDSELAEAREALRTALVSESGDRDHPHAPI